MWGEEGFALVQKLCGKQDTQSRCSGTTQRNGAGRKVGGGFWMRGTHVFPRLIHVDVWQKPPQYYKVIILQLKQINFLKRVRVVTRGKWWSQGRDVKSGSTNDCLQVIGKNLGGKGEEEVEEMRLTNENYCLRIKKGWYLKCTWKDQWFDWGGFSTPWMGLEETKVKSDTFVVMVETEVKKFSLMPSLFSVEIQIKTIIRNLSHLSD